MYSSRFKGHESLQSTGSCSRSNRRLTWLGLLTLSLMGVCCVQRTHRRRKAPLS
ncbi:hypothetical protein [Roseateles flavus]|uniref:hypothetical protein n=1 Tax=Roseateles flavus TaxID=3149041 RepID=UPI00325FBC1F